MSNTPAAEPQFNLQGSTCLALSLSRLGTAKKVSSGNIEVDADKEMVKVGKEILQSETLHRIKFLDSRIRKYVDSRCLPMSRVFKSGVYLVPAGLVEEVDTQLGKMFAEREALIEQFLKEYPTLVDGAREKLRVLFNPKDYPSPARVRASFRAEIQYLSWSVPQALQGISQSIFEREQRRAKERVDELVAEIETTLVNMASGMVEYLQERLTDNGDGKQKMIRESGFEKIKDFFATLGERNVTNNVKLDQLAQMGKAALDGIGIKDVRDSAETREQIKQQIGSLKPVIESMVVDKPARVIEFLDDMEEAA